MSTMSSNMSNTSRQTSGQQTSEPHAASAIILIDFDGVINQFPDDKVRQRQNSAAWMKPGDPRINLYSPANWFIPDSKGTAQAGRFGRYRILWSSELVSRLDALTKPTSTRDGARIMWLSTWQPFTDSLNEALGVGWPTVTWYDPQTGVGRLTGKRRTVLDRLSDARPIIWIDDEETTPSAQSALRGSLPQAPVLAVGPDARIGISRPQMAAIERFAADPYAEVDAGDPDSLVRFDVAGDAHDGHIGF